MKKILLSLAIIGIVGGITVGLTTAYFSDTETSVGNTFTAGAIDLTIDNESYAIDYTIPDYSNPTGELVKSDSNSWTLSDLDGELFFSFIDLKPGDIGEDTISLHVNNNNTWACMSIALTGTPENVRIEPEEDVDATPGTDEGELQDELYFAFWADDGDNVYEGDEEIFAQGLAANLFGGQRWALADSITNVWTADPGTPLTGGTGVEPAYYVGKVWCYGVLEETPFSQGDTSPIDRGTGFSCDGSQVGNESQTDGIVATVEFYAEQSRNNPNFTCVPPIGADLGSYTQTTNCDVTVNSGQSIQTDGVDLATTGETVCVEDGTYTGDVTIDVEDLTLAGAGATATSKIVGDIDITADGVTLEGFDVEGLVDVWGYDDVTVAYNKVTNTGNGINYRHSGSQTIGGTVTHNVVSAPGSLAIYLDHDGVTDFTVTYNTVEGRKAIGFGSLSGGEIKYNTISSISSDYDIEIFDASIATVNYNNLAGDVCNGDGANTLDAENNWWGDNDPSNQVPCGGTVDYDPWESSAFPEY